MSAVKSEAAVTRLEKGRGVPRTRVDVIRDMGSKILGVDVKIYVFSEKEAGVHDAIEGEVIGIVTLSQKNLLATWCGV